MSESTGCYKWELKPCQYGCKDGGCTQDTCSGITCDTPPQDKCEGNNLIKHSAQGTCNGGQCSYLNTTTQCQNGCLNNQCSERQCTMEYGVKCADNIDNDCDGLADCADSNCAGFYGCMPQLLNCEDRDRLQEGRCSGIPVIQSLESNSVSRNSYIIINGQYLTRTVQFYDSQNERYSYNWRDGIRTDDARTQAVVPVPSGLSPGKYRINVWSSTTPNVVSNQVEVNII